MIVEMGIDPDQWAKPLQKVDVTGIAVKVAFALDRIADALETLRDGKKDIDRDIKLIRQKSEEISDIFDKMTGWTDDG